MTARAPTSDPRSRPLGSARPRARYARGVLLLAALVSGCGVDQTDGSYWDRSGAGAAGGSGGSSGSGSGGSGSGAAPAEVCAMITATTVSYGGEYAPENVGAIWITAADGRFVKTLEVWGTKRLEHAVSWLGMSGGDDVDAISGATAARHRSHAASWDCRDSSGADARSAALLLHLELSEDNSADGERAGPRLTVPFDATARGATVTAPAHASFQNVTLTLAP